jgi:hypothetical protein
MKYYIRGRKCGNEVWMVAFATKMLNTGQAPFYYLKIAQMSCLSLVIIHQAQATFETMFILGRCSTISAIPPALHVYSIKEPGFSPYSE